jgi:outer membrane protein OmpA-like peptidoglycan-associated protein
MKEESVVNPFVNHRLIQTASAMLAVALLVGCATPSLDEVERARQELAAAKDDPRLAQNAPVELYEAEKTLNRAAQVWQGEENREEAAHLAYLAERRVSIARAVAEKRIAEDAARALSLEREQVLMEARVREVDVARMQAELALKRAQEEATRAEEQAERARELQARAEEEARRAAELERTLTELKAQRTERGIVLTLGDVLFDFDRAELRRGAKNNLDRLVAFLRKHDDREVIIEGHTDSVGGDSYNLDLSRRRAQAVQDFLTQNGIAMTRIVADGFGEGYPVAGNETQEGRQRNRRVEVVILEPGQKATERVRQQPELSRKRAVGTGPR